MHLSPQGEPRLWPQSAPPARPRMRRGVLMGALLILTLGLVAGLPRWGTGLGPGAVSVAPAAQSAPFAVALDYLAASPEVTYHSATSRFGSLEASVTGHGELVGTATIGGQSYGLLRVAEVVYLKLPTNGLSDTADPARAKALAGHWITGRIVRQMLGSDLSQYVAPSSLAEQLRSALGSNASFTPSATVAGIPVLAAHTPVGVLYVSKQRPYRVMRLAFAATASAAGAAPATAPPWAATFIASAVSSAPSLPSVDLAPGNSSDLTSTYQNLENDTRSLATAVDSDLQFSLQGNGQLSCGDGGCEVTVVVSNTAASGSPGATISGGRVLADLDATIEIEGEPAGGCASRAELPLNGVGELGCDDAGAGAVFASVNAQKRAQAEAQSEAEGGIEVPYEIQSTGQYYVYATAQVDVAKQVATEQREATENESANLCGARNASPGAVSDASYSHTPWLVATRGRFVFAAGFGGSAPVTKGQQGVSLLIRNLGARGFSPAQMWKEVSVVAANGVKVRFDLVAEKDGAYYFFDAKNGPSPGFTVNQGSKGGYASIETAGGRFYGDNAAKPNGAGARLPSSFGPSPVYIQGFGGSPYC